MKSFAPIVVFIFAAACGGGTAPIPKDKAFGIAVESVKGKSFVRGANAAWTFVKSADPDDPRYDRGLRLVARASEGLGLLFGASMIYREIAQTRRNMELVPDALQGIERIVNTDIYDEDTLITSFIASEEFGELPADTRAFVNFHQGLDLARRNEFEWANLRFDMLPKNSPYEARAHYVRAVWHVANGDFLRAKKRLERLRKHSGMIPSLRKKVERALARLAFEEERYTDALKHFETLKKLAPNDPEIILEMAWTYFYIGDSRKTLGLLIALDAPVHRGYISPERFLLEALSLRRLCQFAAAREAAVRLERKHGDSLDELSRGVLPEEIPKLRNAAKQRGFSRDNARFLDRLIYEITLLEAMGDNIQKDLRIFLEDLYARGLKEARTREEEYLRRDMAELTEELLAAREGVRLIVHELGVSMLRGRRRPPGAAEKPAVEVPITGDKVFYPFQGEYWTDELDGLIVIAEDRCID